MVVPPRLRHRLVLEQNIPSHASPAVPESYASHVNSRLFTSDHSEGGGFLSPNWHPNAVIVGDKIPGLKTSAAFLSSLRANLRLNDCPPPSPLSTPTSMQNSTSSLPPPSPLADEVALYTDMNPHSTTAVEELPEAEDPLANVPSLTSTSTTDPAECTAALKLVADSVAQMRQTAGRILIFHPINIAIYVAALAILIRFMYKDPSSLGLTFTTAAGMTMAFLVTVRWATGPYIEAAEKVGLNLVHGSEVLITKFGDEVIGCIIYAFVPLPGEGRGSGGGRKRKGYRCEIRGWAVRIRYRGKGVGTALLEDCVKEAKAKGCDAIDFAEDLPNSIRILWQVYNGPFDKQEMRANRALQTAWETQPKGRRRS